MSRTYRAPAQWMHRRMDAIPPPIYEDIYRRYSYDPWQSTCDGRVGDEWGASSPKHYTQTVTRYLRSRENQRIRQGDWDFPSEQLRHRHSAAWDYW